MSKGKAYFSVQPKNEYWMASVQLRATTGMTKADVARAAGVNIKTIDKFEANGAERMVIGTLRKIVEAMGYELVLTIKDKE
jgi:DNA-binding XRE family transcriptional regulator